MREKDPEMPISSIEALRSMFFDVYLIHQDADVISAVEKRLGKMSSKKSDLWIATRLSDLGVNIDGLLLQKLQGKNEASSDVDDKNARRAANLATASESELFKNMNRKRASVIRYRLNIGK